MKATHPRVISVARHNRILTALNSFRQIPDLRQTAIIERAIPKYTKEQLKNDEEE